MRKGRKNLFEELGRVEGEHSNKNRRAEVSRIHGELNKGYSLGGRVGVAKKGCTGRAKALAKTFKKIAKKRKAA